MIIHSIVPPTIFQSINEKFGKPFNNYKNSFPLNRNSQSACNDEDGVINYVPWSKGQFINFIELVKEKYPVGSMVTLRQIPYVMGIHPIAYEVVYIEELHNVCKYDLDIQQPICISVRTAEGVVLSKCPAVLRALNSPELLALSMKNTDANSHNND